MSVVQFPDKASRFEMRCECGGGMWQWFVEGSNTVLCCLACNIEYEIPAVMSELEKQ